MRGKGRITVIESVYHQVRGQQPTKHGEPWGRELTTDEQPFIRHFTIGEDWQPLELGWFKDKPVSLLILTNQATRFEGQPSEEQKQLAAERVVEISFDGGEFKRALTIAPGESSRFSPVNLAWVAIRCQKGETKCTLALFPI